MAKKQMTWKVKGMNRDLSVSAFNPEFSFENMNMRLVTNESNTALSWVNEKGTSEVQLKSATNIQTRLDMWGVPVGVAVIKDKLVVFTHRDAETIISGDTTETNPTMDYIYVVIKDEENNIFKGKEVFSGGLNLDTEHPLKTLVSYEAEHIQKVYWVDGKNQPRLANITDLWNTHVTAVGITYTQFDFVPEFVGDLALTVEKDPSGGGTFAPGVIQYCYTYINRYGQQTNIVDVSPLYYISHAERGASPEEKTSNLFKITITQNTPESFDFIRLYSIQRTSLNSTPIVKRLDDLSFVTNGNSTYAQFIDDGTKGDLIDPTELLYVGGKDVIVGDIAAKDNTLFMGNITQRDASVRALQDHFKSVSNQPQFTSSNSKSLSLASTYGYYGYINSLATKDMSSITTFKGGENYRFGFQLKKKTGEWTEPVWLGDYENTTYPSQNNNTASLVKISASQIYFPEGFDTSKYSKIRPVIVYPNMNERKVLCQGVLNPTVFNCVDRKTASPYAQASWFFRPYMNSDGSQEDSVNLNVDVSGPVAYIGQRDLAEIDLDLYPYKAMWVLYAQVKNDNLSTIMDTGCVSVPYQSSSTSSGVGGFGGVTRGRYKQVPFWGAITLSYQPDSPDGHYICFLFDSFLGKDEYGNTMNINSDVFNNFNGFYNSCMEDRQFMIYAGMSIHHGWLYYNKPADVDNNDYHFRFYVPMFPGGTPQYYDVKFTSQDLIAAVGENSAASLRYKHYHSLYTCTDAEIDGIIGETSSDSSRRTVYKDTAPKYARNIEIQGSVASYDGVNDNSGGIKDSSKNALVSNTQFFVDQSIVTLNSPDIDFDTNVQTFDTSNLKLHVVGAIPIYSNISSHSITTSTASLYNVEATEKAIEEEKKRLGLSGRTVNGSRNWERGRSYIYTNRVSAGELANNVGFIGSNDAGKRLVSDYLWNDCVLSKNEDADSEEEVIISDFTKDYLIYPWQKSGSLNNDWRDISSASSVLATKRMAHLLFSKETCYWNSAHTFGNGTTFTTKIHLTENENIESLHLSDKKNYFPNVDKVLYNKDGYRLLTQYGAVGEGQKVYNPVLMRYKSTSHAVIDISDYILPTVNGKGTAIYTQGPVFWDNIVGVNFNQGSVTGITALNDRNFLLLGELYNSTGGFSSPTETELQNNTWYIGGPEVNIPNVGSGFNLVWDRGDTYYQRYDCLKTYPFTREDPNQLVEILSFMCETRVNIDGRYDANRGQIDNTNMSPINFNRLNPVYSQPDNYFSYKIPHTDPQDTFKYSNWIAYSKSKQSGADVDLWTNVTLANTLEMDGDKGTVNALENYNNTLIAFQDSGIAKVLYNDNVALSTTEGSPVELANSSKVLGKQYIANDVGCSNKWSIVNSSRGLYFMDSRNKGIYRYNGQLEELSLKHGFSSWCKQNITSDIWNPKYFKGFVGYYDQQNQDVLWINSNKVTETVDGETVVKELGNALAFSDKVDAFTSFYSYGGVPYFVNLNGEGLWIRMRNRVSEIHQHQKGNYCTFFTAPKPYWMTFVANQEMQQDKIFTNLEMRASVKNEGNYLEDEDDEDQPFIVPGSYAPYVPFSELEVWNEYQHGKVSLMSRDGDYAGLSYKHNVGNVAFFKRRYRMWYCDIPRDNVDVTESEKEMGIYREAKHPFDRIRGPWMYMKLTKETDVGEDDASTKKTEIHDVEVTYFD